MTMPDEDKVVGTSEASASAGGAPVSGAAASAEAAAQGNAQPAPDSKGSSAGKGPSDFAAKVGFRSKRSNQSQVAEAEILEPEEACEDTPATESELVAQAKAETAEWQDKFMRLHAEWDTYRRRTTEQRGEEKARAAEKMVENLLPVIDDLERSIDYAQKNGESGLLSGVEAVRTKFVTALVKDGVVVIDPLGAAFDALEAQAVGTVDDASVPDETVADVYQKGYKMGKKVLRPAMVTITSGGPKREATDDSETKK